MKLEGDVWELHAITLKFQTISSSNKREHILNRRTTILCPLEIFSGTSIRPSLQKLRADIIYGRSIQHPVFSKNNKKVDSYFLRAIKKSKFTKNREIPIHEPQNLRNTEYKIVKDISSDSDQSSDELLQLLFNKFTKEKEQWPQQNIRF